MGYLMNKRVLLIVEGKNTEPRLFKKIEELLKDKLQSDFEIVPFGTNIYSLYKKLKETGFNVDIHKILIEIDLNYKDTLSGKFAFTYLIFDFDVQHTMKDETRTLKDIAISNVNKLIEMAKYFIDETDPTIGRLYINYPMIESYKDCDSFFDQKYKDENVRLDDIKHYKEKVGKKKISFRRIDSYTSDEIESLIIQNIFKLNFLMNDKWGMPNYATYIESSKNINVLSKQKELISINEKIAVLNTSLFIVVDYFGDKNNFYTSFIKTSEMISKT